MKKLTLLMILFVVLMCGCGGSKIPKGMGEQTYTLGMRAVEITQEYLDAKITADEAGDKLKLVYNRLHELEFSEYNSMEKIMNSGVIAHVIQLQTSFINAEIMSIVGASGSTSVSDKLGELKEYLGEK